MHFDAPEGMSFTTQTAGTDQKVDSNPDQSGLTAVIHLGPDDTNLTATTSDDGALKATKIDRTIDAGLFVSPNNPSIRVEKYDGTQTWSPDVSVATADKDSDAPPGVPRPAP